MIRFEINELPFTLTNDQFATIGDIVQRAPELDYDVVEGDSLGIVWLWAHHEVEDECENPTRYWIEVDGSMNLAEEVTWDWRGVGAPTPDDTTERKTMAMHQTTRQKQVRGVTYRLRFSWGAGDPHIIINFPGFTPHETIGVYDHEHERSTITTKADFTAEVNEYLRDVSNETILAQWEHVHGR